MRELLDRLSPARRRHSEGVAQTARELAVRFGEPAEHAFLAGLAHDVARELPERELLSRAERLPVWERECRTPVLLHGAVGAQMLRERGVADPVVLEAVRHHICGGTGLHSVSRLVYAADMLEPGRAFAAALRAEAAAARTLDQIVTLVARALLDHLRRQGLPPPPETVAMLTEIQA